MFDFKKQIIEFQNHYREHGTIYNDTPEIHPSNLPVIKITSPSGSNWRVLGIHKLTPSENNGQHNVFLEVFCKQNEREGMRAVYWDWQGRHGTEDAPGPVFMAQKGKDNLMDLPIYIPMRIKLWIQNGDEVKWFHSEWPNENAGNTLGHHSYFICFQERAWFEDIPDIPPDSDLDPDPTKKPILLISKDWLDTQEADDNGFIRVYD